MRAAAENLEEKTLGLDGWMSSLHKMRRLWPYFEGFKPWVWLAAAMIPVIALLSAAPAVILKYVVDQGMVAGNREAIWIGGGLYLGMVVLNYVSFVVQSASSGYAVLQMTTKLRSDLVHHVLTRPARFHDRNMSGALVTRATGDFENLAQSLNQGILSSVADLAKLIGIIGGMFYLSWSFGVFSVIVVLIGARVMSYFSSRLRLAMLESRKRSSVMNSFAQEMLTNNATVKLISGHNHAAKRFDELNERNRQSLMNEVKHDANLFSVLDGISAVCIGVSLYYVLEQVGGSDRYTAGALVAFVQYMFQIFEPLKMLGNKIAMLQTVFTAIERIFGILDVNDTIEGHDKAPALKGDIAVQNLSFRYATTSDHAPILKDVSFSLRSGESLAIVGRTGSGKSTVIRLLTKLYDRYEGSITLDGLELRDLDAGLLQSQMAVVSQDVTIFNDTVAFNVSLGRDGVFDADIREACALAGADRFISRLPGGYDFVASEKGENLSHGQRQLISLARALALKPRILILDEATSSVDPEAEAIFQQAVERILGRCTVVIIAHRLETISKCNYVLVLEQGQVEQFDTYSHLSSSEGAFYRLKHALGGQASH